MIKLTKKQRNEAYRYAYAEVEEVEISYDLIIGGRHVCGRLRLWLELFVGWLPCFNDYDLMVKNLFPEFYLFKPEIMPFTTTNWFEYNKEGKNERLTCLAFCIAMTEE